MEKPRFRRQSIQEAIRIECRKAQVQQVSANPLPSLSSRRTFLFALSLKKSRFTEVQNETAQGLHRELRAKLRFYSLLHGFEGGLAIELLRDETLCFAKAKVRAFDRVLHNKTNFTRHLLPADNQVAA
ncbi:MAG: hypothetical protein ACKVX9_24210 [Blastocatellia bacterium]